MSRGRRIGIQAFLWGEDGTYRQSGVSSYIRHLVQGLAGTSLPGEALVYLPFPEALETFPSVPHLRACPSLLPLRKPTVRILWEHLVFPWHLWKDRIHLLHATMNVAPFWTPCPVVVTVMDLAFWRYPQVHPRGRRLYLGLFTRLSVRRARAVIAISDYTRREVETFLHVPAGRIRVIYPGVDADFQPLSPEEIGEFRRRRGLPERYFLYVGNLEPRKNLLRLVQAYARLRPDDVFLILAGARGWGYAELFREVETLGLTDRVLFPGFVPREELPLWYNGAEAFFYPSLYEGFGLPPLEAMACGTPVVVSTAASLPEVVGSAGLQVAAEDVEALAETMQRLLEEPGLRAELGRRGLAQARNFRWEKMARETADLYRQLLEERFP